MTTAQYGSLAYCLIYQTRLNGTDAGNASHDGRRRILPVITTVSRLKVHVADMSRPVPAWVQQEFLEGAGQDVQNREHLPATAHPALTREDPGDTAYLMANARRSSAPGHDENDSSLRGSPAHLEAVRITTSMTKNTQDTL